MSDQPICHPVVLQVPQILQVKEVQRYMHAVSRWFLVNLVIYANSKRQKKNKPFLTRFKTVSTTEGSTFLLASATSFTSCIFWTNIRPKSESARVLLSNETENASSSKRCSKTLRVRSSDELEGPKLRNASKARE